MLSAKATQFTPLYPKSHLLIVFLLSIFQFLNAQDAVAVRWDVIDAFPGEVLSLVWGKNTSQFALNDQKLNIYEFEGGLLKSKIRIPYAGDFRTVQVDARKFGEYVAIVVDDKYRSHLYRYAEHEWKKDPLIMQAPMKKTVFPGQNEILAYGDFGQLLKMHNGSWRQLPSPITNHIISMLIVSPDSIFIGTRAEGIFLLRKNGGVSQIPFDVGTNVDVTQLKKYRSTCYALLSNGVTLEYRSGKFYKTTAPDNFWKQVRQAGVGFQSGIGQIGDAQLSFSFPAKYFVTRYALFEDTTVLLISREGIVYAGRRNPENYFVDVTGDYEIRMHSHITPKGAAVFDINADGMKDIFLFSVNEEGRNIILQNNEDHPFIDISSSKQVPTNNRYIHFAVGDIDGDTRHDVLFLEHDTSGNRIISYLNSDNAFRQFSEIPPSLINNNQLTTSLTLSDLEGNGHLNAGVTFYYSKELGKGNFATYENSLWGKFSESNNNIAAITKGWALHVLFGDWNNDGTMDFFVSNRWAFPNLVINKGTEFSNETSERLPVDLLYHQYYTSTVDIDNDGDLDLFICTDSAGIIPFANNGKGYFSLHHSTDFLQWRKYGIPKLVFFDSNNDGKKDILIYGLPEYGKNVLMVQKNEGTFQIDERFGNEYPAFTEVLTVDIDNDGDIDLYAQTEKTNYMLVNTLNNAHFITVTGTRSIYSPQLFGTAVSIYAGGHYGEDNYLLGFDIFGINNNQSDYFNDPRLHFGLPEGTYDVGATFPNGTTRTYRNIANGTFLQIEIPLTVASAINVSTGVIVRAISNEELLLYTIIVLLTLALVLFGIRFGFFHYQWDVKLTVGLAVIDLTMFWIILLLTQESDSVIKYGAPLAVGTGGIIVPLAVFAWMQSRVPKHLSIAGRRKEILSSSLSFNHGEWAMGNMNGMILLCQNVPDGYFSDTQYQKQFTERKETFTGSTLPLVKNMLLLMAGDPHFAEETEALRKAIDAVEESLRTDAALKNTERLVQIRLCAVKLSELKVILKSVHAKVFRLFSSDPVQVIKQVAKELQALFTERNISLELVEIPNERHLVVLPSHEFSDVVDNILHNAVYSMEQSSARTITVSLKKFGNRVHINFKDTGLGIPNGMWEAIFEQGYSTRGSTGFGLPSCRSMLSGYGGKISVLESVEGVGTVMQLDLIGVSNG